MTTVEKLFWIALALVTAAALIIWTGQGWS